MYWPALFKKDRLPARVEPEAARREWRDMVLNAHRQTRTGLAPRPQPVPERASRVHRAPPRGPGVQSTALLLQTQWRELRMLCAVTGAPFSVVFQREGNHGRFTRCGIAAGDTLALQLMYARLQGVPEMRAETPQPVAFGFDEVLFGHNWTCPCCGHVAHGEGSFVHCDTCGRNTCMGTVRRYRDDWAETVCHPRCPSYPQRLVLYPYLDPLRGHGMTVYRRQA
jgi:hypothetical protein